MQEGRLEKLKRLPAKEKRKIAALIAGSITGVIFLGWLGLMIAGLGTLPEQQDGGASLSDLSKIIDNFNESLSQVSSLASSTSPDERTDALSEEEFINTYLNPSGEGESSSSLLPEDTSDVYLSQ